MRSDSARTRGGVNRGSKEVSRLSSSSNGIVNHELLR